MDVVPSFPLLNLPNKAIIIVLHNMQALQRNAISLVLRRSNNLFNPLDKKTIRGKVKVMGNAVYCFPLFNLPNKAIMGVLHNMKAIQQIAISLLSERAKNLVKSLDRKNVYSEVQISNNVRINIWAGIREHLLCVSIYPKSDENEEAAEIPNRQLKLRGQKYIRAQVLRLGEEEQHKWKKTGYEVKEWIDHLQTVLNHPKLDHITFYDDSRQFNVKAVQKAFSNFTRLHLGHECSGIISQSIIKTFLPTRLSIYGNLLKTTELCHTILNHNFDHLDCRGLRNETRSSTLNNLLAMNSLSIDMHESRLSEKDLNRFVKHWINGSNQRMEMIWIRVSRALNKNIILNGLNYQVIPKEQKRTIRKSAALFYESPKENCPLRTIEIEGGFDIHQNDGTKATIVLKSRGNYTDFNMYVWH